MDTGLELIRGLDPNTLTNRQVLFAYLRFMVRGMLAGMDVLPGEAIDYAEERDTAGDVAQLNSVIPINSSDIENLRVSDRGNGETVSAELILARTANPHIYANRGNGDRYISVVPRAAVVNIYGDPQNRNIGTTSWTFGACLPDTQRTTEEITALADAYAASDPPRIVPPAPDHQHAFDQTRDILVSTAHDQIYDTIQSWSMRMGVETPEMFHDRLIDLMIDNDM